MRFYLGLALALQLHADCSAWSPSSGIRWRTTKSTEKHETRSSLPMASDDNAEKDSTMNAYERAMAAIAAATGGRISQQQPTAQATTTTTTNVTTSTSEESSMSAYEMALREVQQEDNDRYAHQQPLPQNETTFLEEAFNDPEYVDQEMRGLETTATWTRDGGPSMMMMDDSTYAATEETNHDDGSWGNSIPFQTPGTNMEDPLFQQQPQQQQQAEPFRQGTNMNVPFQEPPPLPHPDTLPSYAQTPVEPVTQKSSTDPLASHYGYPKVSEPEPEPEPVTEDVPQTPAAEPVSDFAGFLQALAPNSDTVKAKQDPTPALDSKESSTTATDVEWVNPLSFVKKSTTAAASSEATKDSTKDSSSSSDAWVPPLTFETPTDPAHKGLSLEQEPTPPTAIGGTSSTLPTAKNLPDLDSLILEDSSTTEPGSVTSVHPQNLGQEHGVIPATASSVYPRVPAANAVLEEQSTDDVSSEEEEKESVQEEEEEPGHPFSFVTKHPKLSNFMSTVWEEVGPKSRPKVDPVKAVADITKDVLGIQRPEKDKTDTAKPAFTVKPGVSKRILDELDAKEKARGAHHPSGLSRWAGFQISEARWEEMKKSRKFKYDLKLYKHVQDGEVPPRQFVSEDCARGNAKGCAKLRDICESADECVDLETEGPPLDDDGQPIMDFDVVVLGGTLGIFYATALQIKGLKVCVAAPRELRGQEQEWNVGMKDLEELMRLGVLTESDIDAAVTTVFDGTRAGFKNREVTPLRGGLSDNRGTGYECYLKGVLNLGVSPAVLIDRVAKRFEEMGGVIKERCPLNGVAVSAQVGCAIDLGSYDKEEDVEPITAKMVLDCMGYGSPVARQQRYGVKPDSMCMVFGSCADGFNPDRNRFADAIYTFNPLQDFGKHGRHQYFWESFPVGTNLTMPNTSEKSFYDMFAFGNSKNLEGDTEGQTKSSTKTTYMFTYLDAHKRRPTLEELMDDYWKLLPAYQSSINDPEVDLDVKRVLYDYFPAYRDSPMKPHFNRVLSVGEAAGIQNPISFGGFRSLSRHIGRISVAVAEAVDMGCLDKDDLGAINCYQPNLSAGWLMRDLMSVKMGKAVSPDFTNRVLAIYLKAMQDLGPDTISPLMHDVLRFDALSKSIAVGILADPSLMGEMVKHVGASKMLEFLGHVRAMGWYSFLDSTVAPFMNIMVTRIKDPRTRFQWRRQMEAWKYGSGNDYRP